MVANGEIKRKGARQKAAAAQRAEKGLPAPGPRPFGYEPDMTTVRPSEAAHISAAYSSLLAGVSASQIARDLNAAGMTTAKGGKPYRHSSVRQMLVNPRYAGLRAHKGDVVGPAVWNGIVTEDVWQAAQAILADDGRRTNKGTGLRASRSPVSQSVVSAGPGCMSHTGTMTAPPATGAGSTGALPQLTSSAPRTRWRSSSSM